MIVTLDVKNGKYYQKTSYYKGNNKCLQTSNNQMNIINYYKNISKDFISIEKLNKDLKIRCSNGLVLIVKNYRKNIKSQLYKYIINSINDDIEVKKPKVRLFNYTRILALALATTTLVTIGSRLIPKEDIEYSYDITYEEENISNPLISKLSDIKAYEEVKDEVNFDKTDFILANRLQQSENIDNSKAIIPLATKLNSYALDKMTSVLDSEVGIHFMEMGDTYGVDAYILLAKAMIESSLMHKDTLPGGKYHNGFAYGIMQIEKINIGSTITAFNYKTNSEESITITDSNLKDIKTNIQIATMIFQNNLQKYNNNMYITLQSYNYGSNIMDMLIDKYALETNQTFTQVINNYDDIGWMKYVSDMHNHPTNYIKAWKGTYGDENYVQDVLDYYIGIQSKNRNNEGKEVYMNLSNLETVVENNKHMVG
ncbi:MAG: transglycosylase SLT domain-containing protein [Bacilli bacterium]